MIWQVAVENVNGYGPSIFCMLFTLVLLQLWRDLVPILFLHAFCILWFSAKTLTEGSSLSGRIFRGMFDIPLPWEERHVSLLKGMESRILPGAADRDPEESEDEDSRLEEAEQDDPVRMPGAY